MWSKINGGVINNTLTLRPSVNEITQEYNHQKKIKINIDSLNLYYGKRLALSNLSMRIPQQEITAIVGPSGCGKTSFINCLNRLTDLIPDCHITGNITLESMDIHSPATDVIRLRRRIGMIFQKPNPFPISIRKNILLPLLDCCTCSPSEQEDTLKRVLQEVGLWEEIKDRLDMPAQQLSGGQQQRLCIARALALQPEVILLDEPCSALDPIASSIIEKLIFRLGLSYTVVMVTHNLPQARRIAKYTAVFGNTKDVGHLVEYNLTKAIFEHPKHDVTAAYIRGGELSIGF